jgi:hypothetical protein
MTLQLLLNFLIYEENFIFILISVSTAAGRDGVYMLWANPTYCKQIYICVFPKQI